MSSFKATDKLRKLLNVIMLKALASGWGFTKLDLSMLKVLFEADGIKG